MDSSRWGLPAFHTDTDAGVCWWAGIPTWTVPRLVMEPGQLVLLDGNTVHARDIGVPGQTYVRLHWYFVKEPLDNATYPITMLGKVFASLFK